MLNWFLGRKERNDPIKRKKLLQLSIAHFKSKPVYVNQNVALAINQEEEKLCISTMKNGQPLPLVYKFSNIIGCEFVEDGIVVPVASIKNWVSEGKVERIDLKILLNDSENPYVLANFLYWEVNKNSQEYHIALKAALRWYNLIGNILQSESTKELSTRLIG